MDGERVRVMTPDERSLIFKWIMSLLQIILTAIAGYAATEIRDLSRAINDLNVRIAVVMADSMNQRSEIAEIKDRVTTLERRK